MKTFRTLIAIFVGVALLAVACGNDSDDSAPTATSEPSAEVMASALVELITVDHTFGQGSPPFSQYLILENTDPAAGDASTSGTSRALSHVERSAIEAAVSPFGPVQWIADADDFITEELTPTVEGAVILGLGEPEITGDTALAPVSLWCGGLCGTWLTYTLEMRNAAWDVTGTEGPIAIS